MTAHRHWFSLLGMCVLTALAASLAFAAIVAGGSVALADHQEAMAGTADKAAPLTPSPEGVVFSGMVTDSHCGARHMRNSYQNSSDCVRSCFRKGASYVLVNGDQRYLLVGGDEALAKLAGERANVTGTRQGDAIFVSSAKPLF